MTVLILAIATILRLVLVNQSLWLDEAIEALALMGKQGPLLKYALADFQPPLYHFVLYGWTRLAGFSELALRTPSLVAGVATVWFVIKIGETLGTKKVGYIAGLLAATNPLLIYYSQEGRTYALTAFLVTASFYYLIRVTQKPSETKYLTCFFLWTILALWTSYLAWVLYGLVGLYLLVTKRYRPFWVLASAATSLALWLPSLFGSLRIGLSTVHISPSWGAVVGAATWKSLPLTWVKFVIGRISFANKYIYGVIVAVLVLLHAHTLRKSLKHKNLPLLAVWLLGPVIVGTFIAMFIPVYQYFRVLFVLPAYLLLLALGLSRINIRHTALLVFTQVACLVIFWMTPSFHREDWRALVHDINDTKTETFAVALPSRNQDAPLIYYGVEGRVFEPKDQGIPPVSRVYYINYVEDLFDGGHAGRANLAKAGYTIGGQKTYPGIAVDIYENLKIGN